MFHRIHLLAIKIQEGRVSIQDHVPVPRGGAERVGAQVQHNQPPQLPRVHG